jgi:hypothetical protein
VGCEPTLHALRQLARLAIVAELLGVSSIVLSRLGGGDVLAHASVVVRRRRVPLRAAGSYPVNNEALAERTRDGRELLGVARQDHVFADECSNHDRRVDNVRSPRSGTRRSRRSARGFGQGLDAASRQET